MAEIKSTIELAMERTRHLSMSEEDRRMEAEAKFRALANRLTLKYLDGEIDARGFHDEFTRLEGSPSARGVAAAEIAKRIDPAGDNRLLLDLLKNGIGMEISEIEAILNDFRTAIDNETLNATEKLKNDLLKKGISGNAIVPNLERDEDWAEKREEIAEIFRKGLESAVKIILYSLSS